MELPDDFFTEDDAILQMQADDDAVNYRRMEEDAMTMFVLEDIDAGETLRIEANDLAELALAVQDEDGAATMHLTPGQVELLATWLTDWLRRNTDADWPIRRDSSR